MRNKANGLRRILESKAGKLTTAWPGPRQPGPWVMHDVRRTRAPLILPLPPSKADRKILLAKVMILLGGFLVVSAIIDSANYPGAGIAAAVLLVGGVVIGFLGRREATHQDH